VREAAAGALAGRPDPAVTQALLPLLHDTYPDVREAAAGALAGRPDPAVTQALLPLLHDRAYGVRRVAVAALAGRSEPWVLTRVAKQGIAPKLPSRRRLLFELADQIADRNYLRLPRHDRPRTRRQPSTPRYTAVPAHGGADPHARERQLLDLATVVRIAPAFTPAEQARARAAATRDPRLKVALEASGYGLTQTLAAAPQLVARWHDAQTADPYAWAVLTAALDAARLGARAPLSDDFLRAAAPGYLTSQQQAQAPQDWFEQAVDYATGTLHGAAAALTPAGAGMGQIAGYIAADYSSPERHA
jgi:hypothetical protein